MSVKKANKGRKEKEENCTDQVKKSKKLQRSCGKKQKTAQIMWKKAKNCTDQVEKSKKLHRSAGK